MLATVQFLDDLGVLEYRDDIVQGTPEWLALRKTKITATDAVVVMGAGPWKTRLQLYHEKLSDEPPMQPNERMQRGIDLEPIAREMFNIEKGVRTAPIVAIRGFLMASLDGIDDTRQHILEIKCPGEKDHALAVSGKVPVHYYPQLQHQMAVCDVDYAWYYSFDGIDGVAIKIERDDTYIKAMIEEERKFYDCLMSKTPPEPADGDYIELSDGIWQECARKWKSVSEDIKCLEKYQEELREQLVFLSGERNSRGAGISLCQVTRRGNIDYSKVPELKDVDLDKYRKESTSSWRICTQP